MSAASYLRLEPLISERLRERVPELRAVLGAREYAAIEEMAPPAPCVYVLYAGDAVDGQGSGEAAAQRWGVVIVVAHAGDLTSGTAQRDAAGPLLAAALRALTNWRPEPGGPPLKRVTAPPPAYGAQFGYFPLAFELPVVAAITTEDEDR